MEQSLPTSFDSSLGGEHDVEPMLNVQDFCRNRIEEILMLTEALKESPFRGQAFQRLPKHMRRRQMSHYIKRLPQRLRNNYLASVKDDVPPPPPKRPSRKYRRRPQNLLLEYNRRQRNNVWLETHIWHSKRFHMISKWGYKLPEKPVNKSFRASYRAASQHCFLNDLSFYNCLELKGSESRLLEGLQKCVSPKCGLTFAAKMFSKGSREGSVTLFHPLSYPYRVIGQISFLWKPFEEKEKHRTIWIFSHPLFYNEIVNMFKILFDLNISETEVVEAPREKIKKKDIKKKNSKSVNKKEEIKLESKNLERSTNFKNEDGSVSMNLLKDIINRFRLTGPLSLSVVSKAFDFSLPLPQIRSKNSKRNYSECFEVEPEGTAKKIKLNEGAAESGVTTLENDDIWWRRFYKDEFHRNCVKKQKEFHESLRKFTSPSDLPPYLVFSLIVKDPRLTLPAKRVKSVPEAQGPCSLLPVTVDTSLSFSPLWDSDIRNEVSLTKMPTSLINQTRSKLVVPGSDIGDLLPEDQQSRIPLIVIQKTVDCSNSGFDIIVPAGWAMPVWLSLVYRGARTGGLREFESLLLESNNLTEYYQPDSKAGEIDNLEKYTKLRNIYFKRPPNKRPNFTKLGVASPFYFPWKVLVKDWWLLSRASAVEVDELKFGVLRDREKLSELSSILEALSKMSRTELIHSFEEEEMNYLVPVSVESLGEGIPKQHAIVCVPTVQDFHGFKNNSCPVEELHVDPNAETRKLLKLEHTKLMKSLKRKRKKDKLKKEEEYREKPLHEKLEVDEIIKKTESSKAVADKYKKKMESLWLQDPENIKSVISTCSRTVMGYVVLGGFSYTKSHGVGLGYVTLRGLFFLMKRCCDERTMPLVLYRNTSNLKYRLGKLKICSS